MVFSFKAIVTLYLVLVTFLAPLLLQAGGQTRLDLQNVPLQDEKLLVVNVLLTDTVDLFGAEIQFSYDPTQLKVRDENARLEGVQIAPGPLLAFDDRFVVKNMADPQAGLISFVFTLLNPAPPISGEGVLATIVFKILGSGPFSVEVIEAQLVSSNLEAMPIITKDLYINSVLEPAATPQVTLPQPAASNVSSWHWWGLIVLSSLVITLGSLVLLYSRPGKATTADDACTLPRRIPGMTRSSTRSSALLAAQGNHALSQDHIQKAYELFSQAIELDPANADAWLGKGLVAQQETEKRICFQRVLALDPDNDTASKALQQID